jgi:alpha-beta hydrolase superfamily lysophospholipase
MDAVAYTTGFFETEDGLTLYYRLWEPDSASKGTVVIVHGLGEHSGRYVHVGKFFAEAGFRAVAFDLRGHGHSSGRPVAIKHYGELANDVESVLNRFGSKRNFLFGHSLGGQLVLWAAQRLTLNLAGVISSAPWLALAFPPPKWQVTLAQKLNRRLPGLRFPTEIDHKKLSRDQAHLDSLEDLNRTHDFITVRMFMEATNAANEVIQAKEIPVPILIVHGGNDQVTSIDATKWFFGNLKNSAKKLAVYPGLCHELHNEPEREKVLADYVTWMNEVLSEEPVHAESGASLSQESAHHS